jgi:integrase
MTHSVRFGPVGRSTRGTARSRGTIDELPSGALRVRVSAGVDPISKRRLYLTELVPAGPKAGQKAERIRTRMLSQVDERRSPRTRGTVDQLLDKWLEVLDVDPSTRRTYEGYIRKHIRPLLGPLSLTRVDVQTLDSFYAELRRCRDHCKGRRTVQHRTDEAHRCDEHEGAPCSPANPAECQACRRACRRHQCRGLASSTVRQVHWILSGALDRAVVWQWIAVNPAEHANKPPLPHPDPRPPTTHEAARLVECAWSRDPSWGALIWVHMTTGARRGEICGLRWSHVNLDTEMITIRRTVFLDGRGQLQEKDTKTHQQRRVVLDAETAEVLREHQAMVKARATSLGSQLDPNGYVFSNDPESRVPLNPEGVTQRYKRMAVSLGIDTTLKSLRHYTATELISQGVDVRAVAGRLGHGGGGATTLRVYTAWTSEADQRAARVVSGRMPARPGSRSDIGRVVQTTDRSVDEAEDDAPYRKIARDLRGAIESGILVPSNPLPSEKTLAAQYGVATSTAHRAIALLEAHDLVRTSSGRRTVVLQSVESSA